MLNLKRPKHITSELNSFPSSSPQRQEYLKKYKTALREIAEAMNLHPDLQSIAKSRNVKPKNIPPWFRYHILKDISLLCPLSEIVNDIHNQAKYIEENMIAKDLLEIKRLKKFSGNVLSIIAKDRLTEIIVRSGLESLPSIQRRLLDLKQREEQKRKQKLTPPEIEKVFTEANSLILSRFQASEKYQRAEAEAQKNAIDNFGITTQEKEGRKQEPFRKPPIHIEKRTAQIIRDRIKAAQKVNKKT